MVFAGRDEMAMKYEHRIVKLWPNTVCYPAELPNDASEEDRTGRPLDELTDEGWGILTLLPSEAKAADQEPSWYLLLRREAKGAW